MGPGTIATRRASRNDANRVWPLVQDFAVSYEPERARFDSSFEELIERPDTLVLVAEEDGTVIVGYALASCHGTFFANGGVAWVEELMVAASARGRGVGRELMAAAEEWARSLPVAYLALVSRRAGDFYLRIGFEASATYYRKTFVPPVPGSARGA